MSVSDPNRTRMKVGAAPNPFSVGQVAVGAAPLRTVRYEIDADYWEIPAFPKQGLYGVIEQDSGGKSLWLTPGVRFNSAAWFSITADVGVLA